MMGRRKFDKPRQRTTVFGEVVVESQTPTCVQCALDCGTKEETVRERNEQPRIGIITVEVMPMKIVGNSAEAEYLIKSSRRNLLRQSTLSSLPFAVLFEF